MTLPILQERGGPFSGLMEGLNMGVQQSLPTISDLIMNRQKQKQQQQLIDSILRGSPTQSASQGQDFDQMLGMNAQQPGTSSQGLEITPEKILAISSIDPQMAANMSRIFQGQEKERMAKQKAHEETQVGQDAFNRMSELLNKGNVGFGSKYVAKAQGGEVAEDVGEFESLLGALESMLVDRVSRGTLSNSRFNYITKTLLPTPNDRSDTIRGKLKGLARELKLDPAFLKKGIGAKKVRMFSGGKAYDIPEDKVEMAEKQGFTRE